MVAVTESGTDNQSPGLGDFGAATPGVADWLFAAGRRFSVLGFR